VGALRGSNCLNDLVDTVCLSCPLRRYVGFAEVEASSPRTEMITREREANHMMSVVKGDGWVGRSEGPKTKEANESSAGYLETKVANLYYPQNG
jgi:hypothetical protein